MGIFHRHAPYQKNLLTVGFFCSSCLSGLGSTRKKKKKKSNYYLEFKICLVQKETVKYRGKLVHCPKENPERD